MNYLTKIIIIIMLCLIAGLFWVIDRNKILKQKYVKINETLTQQIVENKNYQLRIKQLYQMDTQRLQELASAKSEIDRLRSYAERDPERVYIRASCAKNDANSTSRVDDATRARPTDAAIRNYWILRERIAQSESIILGLQDYIRQECIN
ncbi:lysis protein [Proteus mirabilis]|uniref:lysis protein n=1 Tax=Proteus mirabilis TaxID=584 RepID=UPI0020A16F5C|nr:lysis protein [Proteus mirabilis]UTA56603.1 lysis protein [Proteus mirabilis]UTA59923.1 lysis protein [Proteus mirabilis]UTA63246.1 lysis protein [Proteus mirabilis]